MPAVRELISIVLKETVACRDPTTPEARSRINSQYAPFGAYIPGENGSYPTTDAAMNALAQIADNFRANNHLVGRTIGRDKLRAITSQVIGRLLPELQNEQDTSKHWPLVRLNITEALQAVPSDLIHYVPVWLFLRQECRPFSIGPVQFIERKDWLEKVAVWRGKESSWMPAVKAIWSGKKISDGSLRAGLKAIARAIIQSPLVPSGWAPAFRAAHNRRQIENSNVRNVARIVHPDQWIACVETTGFEQEESRRRGVLAARVALDTIRLAIPSPHLRLLSTASDSVVPFSEQRLSQAKDEDLKNGWRFNRPGVSGAPGMATEVIGNSMLLFEAAGACIATTISNVNSIYSCPRLSDQWCNAVHWFGRSCLSDGDFIAVVMLVIALDVLCGGLEEQGILELVARLTGTAISDQVLSDGTTLEKLILKSYKLRSEVVHGSVLAVQMTLDVERARLENLAAAAISVYAIKLHEYSKNGGIDDRDSFRFSLPPAKP